MTLDTCRHDTSHGEKYLKRKGSSKLLIDEATQSTHHRIRIRIHSETRVIKMKKLIQPLVIALVALCQIFSQAKGDPSCIQKLQTMDQFAAKILVISDPQLKSYSSVNDFDLRYCQQFSHWIKQGMLPYRNCLRPFQRTLFNVAIRNMKKQYNEYCLNPERMQQAYNHIRCLSEENKSEMLRISASITAAIDFAASRENVNEIIPALCCGTHDALTFVESQMTRICRNKTGPLTGKHFVRVANTTASDAVDMLCGQYQSMAQCIIKVPQLTTQLRAVIHSPSNKYTTTPLIPLMQLLNKLDMN